MFLWINILRDASKFRSLLLGWSIFKDFLMISVLFRSPACLGCVEPLCHPGEFWMEISKRRWMFAADDEYVSRVESESSFSSYLLLCTCWCLFIYCTHTHTHTHTHGRHSHQHTHRHRLTSTHTHKHTDWHTWTHRERMVRISASLHSWPYGLFTYPNFAFLLVTAVLRNIYTSKQWTTKTSSKLIIKHLKLSEKTSLFIQWYSRDLSSIRFRHTIDRFWCSHFWEDNFSRKGDILDLLFYLRFFILDFFSSFLYWCATSKNILYNDPFSFFIFFHSSLCRNH